LSKGAEQDDQSKHSSQQNQEVGHDIPAKDILEEDEPMQNADQ
jgi:hypothetical protein